MLTLAFQGPDMICKFGTMTTPTRISYGDCGSGFDPDKLFDLYLAGKICGYYWRGQYAGGSGWGTAGPPGDSVCGKSDIAQLRAAVDKMYDAAHKAAQAQAPTTAAYVPTFWERHGTKIMIGAGVLGVVAVGGVVYARRR